MPLIFLIWDDDPTVGAGAIPAIEAGGSFMAATAAGVLVPAPDAPVPVLVPAEAGPGAVPRISPALGTRAWRMGNRGKKTESRKTLLEKNQ